MAQINLFFFSFAIPLLCLFCTPENHDPNRECVTGTYSSDDISMGVYFLDDKNNFIFAAYDYLVHLKRRNFSGIECMEFFETTICGLTTNRPPTGEIPINFIDHERVTTRSGESIETVSYGITRNNSTTRVFSSEAGEIIAFDIHMKSTEWVRYVVCDRAGALRLNESNE